MFPRMNQRDVEKAMKKLGIRQEEINAVEVVIKCADRDLVVRNPQVSRVNMMGQETIQVVGKVEEVAAAKFSSEDVKTVARQAGVSEEVARGALEESGGDLARAILSLQK